MNTLSSFSQEAIEAAAEVVYRSQTGADGYRTSMYKGSWDRLAAKALTAAVQAQNHSESVDPQIDALKTAWNAAHSTALNGEKPSVHVTFWGGKCHGASTYLRKTPPSLTILGETYSRVEDPDTGDFLGLYVSEEESYRV